MAGYAGDDTTGFQSPAQDHIEPVIDLPALLDLRRPQIYPVRVIGQASGITTSWSSTPPPTLSPAKCASRSSMATSSSPRSASRMAAGG